MWNYLIITASNDQQAAGYRSQLDLRLRLGLLGDVENVLVVADPGGKRVGSGGSTLFCLMRVLEQQMGNDLSDVSRFRQILSSQRILIIHAGGDSKRLPAYGPCGKIFVPVPGKSDSCLPLTLFDRQLPTYLALPAPPADTGQVVITSGDVMLLFDPSQVSFDKPGLTGLGCHASPDQASNHGVFCGVDSAGRVKQFLQKPTVAQQQALGATDHYGQSILDVGVMNFDANTAVRLLETFGVCPDIDGEEDNAGKLKLSGKMGQAVTDSGLDFYRELCCSMGSEVTPDHHIQMARDSGSTWDDSLLTSLMESMSNVDFNLELLRQCDFIDFGTSRNIIRSGNTMIQQDRGSAKMNSCLDVNNGIYADGQLIGSRAAWVEGCSIKAPLTLAGENVVTGIDVNVDHPLTLPTGACLDVIAGNLPDGRETWFVRCYDVNDTFKDTLDQNATLCGMGIIKWLEACGADPGDIWDDSIPTDQRTLWDGRVFPAVESSDQYRDWLWMYDPAAATAEQLTNWKEAARYSLAEIAQLTDQNLFFNRRQAIRSEQIKNSLRSMLRSDSELSAKELIFILTNTDDRPAWIAALIREAKWHYENDKGINSLVFPRIIHTLATVLENLYGNSSVKAAMGDLSKTITAAENDWLNSIGLNLNSDLSVNDWAKLARNMAFDSLSKAIIFTGSDKAKPLPSELRSDEIVWGRCPARFDTGGGWTDTPPYSLEYGGCVVNTAIDLNGQSPIQSYMRVTDELSITIGSIDLGTRIQITDLEELLDYREPTSKYGLVKAALALSGFSPEITAWPEGITLKKMLKSFGGGIEITTLAAIPKGSGLGTSSIMGAVILAVIHRVMGVELTQNELFNKVLQLEQALTTGGGWQDQVGGIVGGTKIVYTNPGLVPDPKIHYLPHEIIDPATNGGATLLYYTGITRLAKNILEQVVGRYLDRNRESMATLSKINKLTTEVAESLSRKDLLAFGRLVDSAWNLNKQLDPNSTNQQVEKLFERVRPHIYGGKLLGAGGGGFMLMVCKSPQDALDIRAMLQADPPNERSRFFDFNVNKQGLVVTVC